MPVDASVCRLRSVKVFLSWSGATSRSVAEALRSWLPQVIQEVDPFVSSQDIASGTRWRERLEHELAGSAFGIVCVTRENQASPWINFEAGAIAKQVDMARVVPLAIDLKPSEVKQPMGDFQATQLDKHGMLSVLSSINDVAVKPLPKVEALHEVWWPHLESRIQEALTTDPDEPARSADDMIEEILLTVRTLATKGQTEWMGPSFQPVAHVNTTYDVSQFPAPLLNAFTNSVARQYVERQSTIELTHAIHPLLPEDARISFLKDPYTGQTNALMILSSTDITDGRKARISTMTTEAGYRIEFVKAD
jgi:hypothetical protein